MSVIADPGLRPPPIAAPEPRQYAKIPQDIEKTWKLACAIIFSIGLYLGYLVWQSSKLRNALQTGKISAAEEAIKRGGWWFYDVKSEDIRRLALKNEIESIKLIKAQIHFDKTVASGGSEEAKAFIVARDDMREVQPILQDILSEDEQPKTTPDPMNIAGSSTFRVFEKEAELEFDPFFTNYLAELYSKNKDDRVRFIHTFYDSFPSCRTNTANLISSRIALTEYYDNDGKPEPQKTIKELFKFSIEDLPSEGDLEAFYEKFPTWKANKERAEESREFLTKYYNNPIAPQEELTRRDINDIRSFPLKDVLRQCRSAQTGQLEIFIQAFYKQFPSWEEQPVAAAESREFLTQYYLNNTKPKPISIEELTHIYSACRKDLKCSPETFINAVFARDPHLQYSSEEKRVRKDLEKFYRKHLLSPYSGIASFREIHTLTQHCKRIVED